ncbi:MAG TPA: reverse transcriptase family protein, partial [Nitrospiria bacterium]|nr:reverse transcriptase family protein [Nitrospiria bacterium]
MAGGLVESQELDLRGVMEDPRLKEQGVRLHVVEVVDQVLKAQQVIGELRLEASPFLREDPKLKGEVEELVREYLDLFTDQETAVGHVGPEFYHEFRIRLEPGAAPIRQGIRPLPFQHKESLKVQLASWLRDGVIRPGHSPWGSALVPVLKKDGTLRWTVDYRGVNKQTIPDSFPTPRIDTLLADLGGSSVFSTVDAAQAYHNISVCEDSQPITAFVCAFGTYLFNRMPFGLMNAGAEFSRLMLKVADHVDDPGFSAYLDDELLHTEEQGGHFKLLGKVFRAHRASGIKINARKTHLFQDKVDYLGFEISGQGIRLPDKVIRDIREWPSPTNSKEVGTLLGFFGYYRDFLGDFAELTAGMSDLRGKNAPFLWTQKLESQFSRLKELFCQEGGPVRRYPLLPGDPLGGQFVVHIDFSQLAVCGILHQMQRAHTGADWVEVFIAAKGRKCQGYERNYHSSKGELLAVVFSLQKFEHFLLLSPFTVVTDNKTVANWVTMKDPGGTVRRWMEYLQKFSFSVVHRPGRELVNADSLSRATHLLPPTSSEASAAADRAQVHRLPCGWEQFQGLEGQIHQHEGWECERPSSSVHPTEFGRPSSSARPRGPVSFNHQEGEGSGRPSSVVSGLQSASIVSGVRQPEGNVEVFPFPLPEGNPDYLYEETPADPPLETREEGRSIWQWEDLIAAQKADEILRDIWGWKQEEQAGRGGKPPVIRDSHPEREVLVRRWTKISVSPVPQSKYGLRALYYDHRLIVPLALRREIIKSAHTP